MIYRAIGLMSGSSLDGLDIAYVEFEEKGGRWTYSVLESTCMPYGVEWEKKLESAIELNARDYASLHAEYGHYLGKSVNQFIEENSLHYKVSLVASHGHTTFHVPGKFSAQLGDGAAIASTTGLPVVSDLRSIDVALGGQGAPIVPVGEKLLFEGHELFLNLGGISNISYHQHNTHRAFDVCPANRVLNLLSMKEGKSYDEDGQMASSGRINEKLLEELNGFSFYTKLYPKSLENEFGTEIIYPKILSYQLSVSDALATYVEHIAFQIANAVKQIKDENQELIQVERSLFITGGGAFNKYLVSRIENYLLPISISIVVPEIQTVKYKEAVIMALLGVLRWREEETVYASVTGASRNSIGGALWLGAN